MERQMKSIRQQVLELYSKVGQLGAFARRDRSGSSP
jgi:hypothetical protein